MTNWMAWFGLAGILVICEMFTGTFYLLMIGFGFAAGGLVALAGLGGELQLIAAATVGIFSVFALRRSKWGRTTQRNAASDPNVNLDIGQALVVDTWNGNEGGARTARVKYRGALWDVELEQGAIACSGIFVIREIRGSRLIVANSGSK